MAEREDLPEEIVLNIFSRLPVKSLIRFASVSKRLHSIILHDPEFAQSQFQAARHNRRLLCSTSSPQLESLDLDDTPSFGEPSKLTLPFQPQPELTLPFQSQRAAKVLLLGSCNGLVFVAFDDKLFYIWNPSNGFFKELPQPFSGNSSREFMSYGAGYSSSTDDYKVLAAYYNPKEIKMFSLRAHVWKTIKREGVSPWVTQGTLLNEAIHWVNETAMGDQVLAFDFGQEKFRTMSLPDRDVYP